MAIRECCHRIINRMFIGKPECPSLTLIGKDERDRATPLSVDKQYPHKVSVISKAVDDHADEEGNHGIEITVAYGLLYRNQESDMWKKLKEEAWNHVCRTTGSSISTLIVSEEEIYERYFRAVRKVMNQAQRLYCKYDDKRIIDHLMSDNEYVRMMIHDGCFLLLLVLFIMGREKKLEHIVKHPVFGQLQVEKVSMIRDAVSSMFAVGNQIPLIVLKALMKQSFFEDIVNGGIWESPMDLERWVLYELLLVPCLMDGSAKPSKGVVLIPTASLSEYLLARRIGGNSLAIQSKFSATYKRVALRDVPIDLLHGLWLLVTGSSQPQKDASGGYVYAGEDDSTSRSDHIYDVFLQTVRSATELKQEGIVFQCNEGTKINGIRFKKVMFNATLVIPRLTVDSEQHYKMLLSNVIRYEITHFGQNQRKVCEYLQLMRELVRSPDDVKVLAASGVIIVDPNLEEKIPLLFRDLPIPKVMRSHGGSLRRVRDELNSYTRHGPFKKFGEVLTIVVIFSLIQTVYTMLSVHLKK